MTKYENLDFVSLNNRLAKQHPDSSVEKVASFKNDDDARATVSTALQATGDRIIRLLRPDYIKRGMAAKRFARYKDGMLVSELVEAFETDKDSRGAAMRDIRYNDQHGLIKVFA